MLWINLLQLVLVHPLRAADVLCIGEIQFVRFRVYVDAERILALDKRLTIEHVVAEFVADFQPAEATDSRIEKSRRLFAVISALIQYVLRDALAHLTDIDIVARAWQEVDIVAVEPLIAGQDIDKRLDAIDRDSRAAGRFQCILVVIRPLLARDKLIVLACFIAPVRRRVYSLAEPLPELADLRILLQRLGFRILIAHSLTTFNVFSHCTRESISPGIFDTMFGLCPCTMYITRSKRLAYAPCATCHAASPARVPPATTGG